MVLLSPFSDQERIPAPFVEAKARLPQRDLFEEALFSPEITLSQTLRRGLCLTNAIAADRDALPSAASHAYKEEACLIAQAAGSCLWGHGIGWFACGSAGRAD